MTEHEPLAIRAAIVAAITAILSLAVVLGWDIPAETQAAIVGAIGSLSGLVVAIWTRGKVTPVADPRDSEGYPLESVWVDPDGEDAWAEDESDLQMEIPGEAGVN